MLDPDQKTGAFFISDIALVPKCRERRKAPLFDIFLKNSFFMKMVYFHFNAKRPPSKKGA